MNARREEWSAMPVTPSAPLALDTESGLFLFFSRKKVQFLGLRFSIWKHVGILLVDRDSRRATFYDLVSSRKLKAEEAARPRIGAGGGR
jgi:hypothetical protein